MPSFGRENRVLEPKVEEMPSRYSPQETIRVREHLGWTISRQRGSYVIMTREGQLGLVAVPGSVRQVPIGTFGNILRQAGITRRLFETAAEEVL